MHSGNSFDIGNKELLRILSDNFSTTTLEDIILGHKRTHNGSMAQKIIKAKIEGAI